MRGVLAAFAAAWLTGCSPAPEAGPLAGRTTVASALVCIDRNGSGGCDPGEPAARTGADGTFAVPASAGASVVLVEVQSGVSRDSDTGELIAQGYRVAAAPGHRHLITPFSSMTLDLQERLGTKPEEALRRLFSIPESVFLLPTSPLRGPVRAAGFARIAATLYASAQEQARAAGASPLDARRVASQQLLDAAPRVAGYFGAALVWQEPVPPLLQLPRIDELIEAGQQGLVLAALSNGPGSFGAALDEVKGAFVTGAACVDVAFENLQRTCRNQWSFEVEILSSAEEVVRRASSALGAKANVIVATASGNMSAEDYKRRYHESVHVYLDANMKRCNFGLTGALKGVHAPDYTADYDRFFEVCGNLFLSDITTGGRFIGTFDKDFASTEEKEEFKLKLKAKVAGITVYDHTWRDRTNKAFAELDMSVQILSTDGNTSIENGSLETLTQRFADFAEWVQGADCATDDAYKTCAYTGSFADYNTATGLAQDPSQTFAGLRENYYLWLAARAAYEEALARANDVVARPDLYNLAGSTDPFYDVRLEGALPGDDQEPSPPSLASIQTWITTLREKLSELDSTVAACEEELAQCASRPVDQGYLTWVELYALLPMRKVFVQADCAELSYQYGFVTNADYTAYYGGDLMKPYLARCKAMETAEPETYLVLPNTSPDENNLSANYAVRVDPEGQRSTQLLRALRLQPATSGGVYRLQGLVPREAPDVVTTFAHERAEALLVAATCDASKVRSNLDLGGTPFRFPADVTDFVKDQDGAPAPATLSADGQVLEVEVQGTGAGCVSRALVPPMSGVDLEYVP